MTDDLYTLGDDNGGVGDFSGTTLKYTSELVRTCETAEVNNRKFHAVYGKLQRKGKAVVRRGCLHG